MDYYKSRKWVITLGFFILVPLLLMGAKDNQVTIEGGNPLYPSSYQENSEVSVTMGNVSGQNIFVTYPSPEEEVLESFEYKHHMVIYSSNPFFTPGYYFEDPSLIGEK